MPNRRKTATELALSGAAKHKPARYGARGETPQAGRLCSVPKRLSTEQKQIWRRIVEIAPEGVLTAADEFALELAVKMIERSRVVVLKSSELSVLTGLLGKLGLTPGDRAKLTVQPGPPKPVDDPWEAF